MGVVDDRPPWTGGDHVERKNGETVKEPFSAAKVGVHVAGRLP